MSFKNYFISKSPFTQIREGDPLKDLMNKLYAKNTNSSSSSGSSSYSKSTNLSAKYNPNQIEKTGAENLLNKRGPGMTKEEINKSTNLSAKYNPKKGLYGY